MGTGRTVDKNGIQEAPTLPCPALALSSHPLWTVHSHIVEEPPKHKRTDWGNLLEIFCCIISNGLSTSRLTLASLFLEKTRFSPSGNMHYISEHLSLSTISSDASVCLAVEGKWGGRCLDFDLAHHPSQRCGWNMVVGFGDPSQPPPPRTLPFEVATLKPWKKSLGTPRNTGWGFHSLLGRNRLAKPCCFTNV